MNKATVGQCQSAAGPRPDGWARPCLPLIFACWAAFPVLTAAGAPPPPPPAWRDDLNAALTLQTAFALAPDGGPDVESERKQRLGQLYTQLVARYPDQAEVQKAAGNWYNQTDQANAALLCWLRAETLDPRDAAVAHDLGSALLAHGQIREASEQFERAVKAKPEVAAYHFSLANVLFLFRRQLLKPPGRADEEAALLEALGHFRRAAELSPTDPQLAQAYAETFYQLPHPDWSQAFAAWKTVLRLSAADTDFAYGHLARVSLRLRHPADVETYLALIRSPAFNALKTKFRQQAAVMNDPGAPLSEGSPAAIPQ